MYRYSVTDFPPTICKTLVDIGKQKCQIYSSNFQMLRKIFQWFITPDMFNVIYIYISKRYRQNKKKSDPVLNISK